MQLFITHGALKPRSRRMFNVVCVGIAACWLLFLWVNLASEVDDFGQYWQAGRNLIQTGDAYATTGPAFAHLPADQRPAPYPNPPLLAYLIQPLAWLPHMLARQIWFLLNCVLAIFLVFIVLRLFSNADFVQWWGVVLLLTLLAPTTRLCLQLGQLGLWLAVLSITGYAVYQRHPRIAGALLAFGAFIKLYPGLIALYYLFGWRRAVVAWAVTSGLVLGIGSLLLHGVGPYITYAQRVLFSGFYPYEAEFNISLVGFWRRLLVRSDYGVAITNYPLLATVCVAVCAALLLALCSWLTYRFRASAQQPALFSLWLCAMLLLSPVNGYYNLVALLLPILVVLHSLIRQPNRNQRNSLFAALLLLNIPPTWSDAAPWYAFVHVGWGLLLLTPSFYGIVLLFGLLVVQLNAPSASKTAAVEDGRR